MAARGSGLASFKEQWGAEPVEEYRFDYVPGGAPSDPAPETRGPASLADGRTNESLVARAIERAPVPVLGAAGRIAYRL